MVVSEINLNKVPKYTGKPEKDDVRKKETLQQDASSYTVKNNRVDLVRI